MFPVEVTTSVRLPCGCNLKHSAIDRGPVAADKYGDAIRHLGAALAHWVETRSKQHQCELVSESNPAGVPR